MSGQRAADPRQPDFVAAPDPKLVEGVRAYHEPQVPHPLQLTFLDASAEQAWIADTRALLTAGRPAEACSRVCAELAGFDGKLARLCKAISPEEVLVEGWDDLLPILEEWEGPAITAITMGLTNPPDLVFEAGKAHAPDLLINLYSDEAFPFTRTTKADLHAECSKDSPAWLGADEDVEFYCTMTGLDELNTALIECKHRHFLRDGRDGVEGRAPGGYVEFQLAGWFMAALFLQSVERAIAAHGLPKDCRPIVGAVDTNADFICVLGPDRAFERRRDPAARAAEPAFAQLTVKPWIPSEEGDSPAPEATLRQRLQSAQPAAEPRAGFFARLASRFKRS